MKTSLLPRLVNGQTGDPALFVDIMREKRALLFDCGDLSGLSPAEILRISDVFISHAHIDHFIGFDHLLRLHIGRGKRVKLYGPRGITSCVQGKLSGYTWNLVKRQRLVFEVREFDGKRILATEFLCRNRFRQRGTRLLPESDILWRDDLVVVRSAVLDHKIPSLAFSVSERDFYNVDPVKLKALGKTPGPWINELKRLVRSGKVNKKVLNIDGENHDASFLAQELLVVTKGKTLVYAADAQGSEKNVKTIVSFAKGTDVFFCEGAFLHADQIRAFQTYHLTARQAGEIARAAGVKRLIVFHFSPKYEGRFGHLEEEARRAFRGEN